MLFGAHVSASGGLHSAPENAAAIGCEVFQFFSRPPQGGPAPALTAESIARFRQACDKHGFNRYVIHGPYVINLASVEERIRDTSIKLIREELERGTALGAEAVMFHPGSAKDVDQETGLKMAGEGVKEILRGYRGTTKLLVEISAGAGNVIGDAFEEISSILEAVGDDRVEVCFDTAHAFASGYDLRTKTAVDMTLKAFDKVIGLGRLAMSHCNDSKVELGAKKDRHEHIGEGFIGLDGFKALLGHPSLKDLPWVLETEPGEQANDLAILKKIRKDLREKHG